MENLQGINAQQHKILQNQKTHICNAPSDTNSKTSSEADFSKKAHNLEHNLTYSPSKYSEWAENVELDVTLKSLHQFENHDKDKDIVLLEIQHGCENTRLCEDVSLTLHKLENLQLLSCSSVPSEQIEKSQLSDNKLRHCPSTKTNQMENDRTYQRNQSTLKSDITDNPMISDMKTDTELQVVISTEVAVNKVRTRAHRTIGEREGNLSTLFRNHNIEYKNFNDVHTTRMVSVHTHHSVVNTLTPKKSNASLPSTLLHSSVHILTIACLPSIKKLCQESGIRNQDENRDWFYNSHVMITDTLWTTAFRQWHTLLFKSNSLDIFNKLSSNHSTNTNIQLQVPEVNLSRFLDIQVQQPWSTVTETDQPALYKTDNSQELETPRSLQIHNAVSKLQSLESRPIYPNVPYSPYASPYGSPRSNRRRHPLRESRRISIEQSGSFLQLNQYKLMDQIGQGSYGLVKLAYSEEDSTHYAMKILSKRRLLRQAGLLRRGPKKTTSPLDRVYREIAVLKKLDHPNVVKLVEVLDDPMKDSLYLVFELVKNGEVLSIPTDKPLSEQRAWNVFRDTLLGLEYLHYQRIIHADLKPGNLLLTECGHVKIADLGVCNEFLGEDATISNGLTAGTPAFRAPETLSIGQNVYCGKAADIWALGITLYSIVVGNVPFIADSIPILYEKIKNESFKLARTAEISGALRDCIQCMLVKDPTKRITLQQLKEHEWVTNGGLHPLPSENRNCCLVQVSDDDINSVVRSIPKLDTLILIKTMLKKHSFGNPFLKDVSGIESQCGGSRLERFVRAGRSNSAPGAYNTPIDRQLSSDKMLPSLSELV